MYIGLDGSSIGISDRGTAGINRETDFNLTDKIYLLCAVHFGWDKYTVDKQPFEYLNRLITGFLNDSYTGEGSGGAMTTSMNKLGKALKWCI
mgnify:CR=1 FL=1